MDPSSTDAAAEANRLYWETDLPVGDIAAQLDLSRRALYDAIRPVPAEGQCAACGGPLEYTKRSSRLHGMATCGNCGAVPTAPAAKPQGEPWTWSPRSHTARGPLLAGPPQSSWMLGAAALAGALLAAGITLVLVRPSARE